jgi:hypothetical protein
MARPKFSPTEAQRRQVKSLSAYGIKHDEIALVIGIAPKTLRKHFHQELERGRIEANAQISRSLYQKAVAGNVTALIFLSKVRLGWREQVPPDTIPIAPPDFIVHGPVAREGQLQ